MVTSVYIKELTFLRKNLSIYLNYWSSTNTQWQPHKETFSTHDLFCHLCLLPKCYSLILMPNNDDDDDILKYWGGPWNYEPDILEQELESGCNKLTNLLNRMSIEDLTKKKYKWPFGEPLTALEHLHNMFTHVYHHRGQLHLYLKLQGVPVNTNTIYSTN
ncbi:DinB family protein [Bacillus sp. JJ1562]|uniref:DinB family protein n=1 Tax=Bacillus sp. JJ1562 TaxID=3122960 RepID=UPI0030023CCA